MSLRDDLLGVDDLRTDKVFVPQWKKDIHVRELGLEESLSAYETVDPDSDGKITVGHSEIARIVAYGVYDPDTGERVFTDEDIPKLARKNTKALMLLYTRITALSGSVEDEVKN